MYTCPLVVRYYRRPKDGAAGAGAGANNTGAGAGGDHDVTIEVHVQYSANKSSLDLRCLGVVIGMTYRLL